MVEYLTWVCGILNNHEVRYLIIGGAAVNIYGYIRLSRNSRNEETDHPDIDIWFEPTYENYLTNLCGAFEELGLDADSYRKGSSNIRKIFIRESFEDFDLDFLPVLESFPKSFSACYRKRNEVEIKAVKIPLLAVEDIISSKKNSQRPKDLKDIEELKKLLDSE